MDLPVEFIAELLKESANIKHLIDFEWSTPQRWSDLDENIRYPIIDGQWYYSRDIKFDPVQISNTPKLDSVRIHVDDVDRSITSIILSEDIKNARCNIYAVPIDASVQPVGLAKRIFRGFCDKASRPQGSKKWTIDVYNHMKYWDRVVPRTDSSATCPWDFKDGPDKVNIGGTIYVCIEPHVADLTANKPPAGTYWATYWAVSSGSGGIWTDQDWYFPGTCRYVGAETWCDGSPERCTTLSNYINYGGNKWITNLQDKTLTWGRADRREK